MAKEISENKNVRKIDAFTVKKNRATSINSATIISSFGLILGLGLTLVTSNDPSVHPTRNLSIFSNQENYLFISNFISSYVEFLLIQIGPILTNLAAGWFVGGLIAGIIYGKEGSNGPFYAVRSIGLFYIPIILTLVTHTLLFSANNDVIILDTQFFVYFCLAIIAITLPLTLVGSFGYRLALFIST